MVPQKVPFYGLIFFSVDVLIMGTHAQNAHTLGDMGASRSTLYGHCRWLAAIQDLLNAELCKDYVSQKAPKANLWITGIYHTKHVVYDNLCVALPLFTHSMHFMNEMWKCGKGVERGSKVRHL